MHMGVKEIDRKKHARGKRWFVEIKTYGNLRDTSKFAIVERMIKR